ncbi:MAG: hypothetical protein K1X88_04650 [Nannocystaceae bacterium]|nr:hypothetical protein [Nannocystaceae bacterium]
MLTAVPPASARASSSRTHGTVVRGAPLDQTLARLDAWLEPWRERVRERAETGSRRDRAEQEPPWALQVPDVGPSAEVLLADRLLHALLPAEREGLLTWIRESQHESGAWLDVHGRPDLSITALAYWALADAGDDRSAEAMVKAVRVVHALGGAQRANFEVRLWLAMAGQIDWSWLPAIPAELFLLPGSMPLSPARFSPWARGVLTPYLLIARAPARLHLADASELLLRRGNEALVAPRLTRPGLAGDLLQAFDRTVKLSRKLPRGPLPRWAQQRAQAFIDGAQQEHGGWFSARPTLLSLLALRVMGARSDDPRIARGLAYLRAARGRVLTPGGTVALAQGLLAAPMGVCAGLLGTGLLPTDAAWLVREQLHDRGPWQARADAPAGGWPLEPGARAHLDLAATLAVLETLAQLRPEDAGAPAAWSAARRASAVLLAMQEGSGAFARFERGETEVFMQRLPWTDGDLLAYGRDGDATHVQLTADALTRLCAVGLRAEDDRVARGIAWLRQAATRRDPPGLSTSCAIARAAAVLLPESDDLRVQTERRIRNRQRDDGSFGSLLDTALALRALVELGHTCVQTQRAVRHIMGAVEQADAGLGLQAFGGGFGLSPDTVDPTAAARHCVAALRAYAVAASAVTELRA